MSKKYTSSDIHLQMNNLGKNFGGVKAVDNVSFTVRKGVIKSLIGPNGAGKTTMFNMISGSLTPSTGQVFFNGKLITGLKPYQIAREGVFRTFQNLKLSNHLSVLDNVLLGWHSKGKAGFISGMLSLPNSRKEEKLAREEVLPIMEWMDIINIKDIEVGNLSFGNQRAVELARALASNPSLLLLDEPAAGLNMHETAELAERIEKLRDQERTILLVEHDMSLVMDISDEIVVLDFGQKIADGIPSEIQKNEDVIRIYLGGENA